jgi:hypothetical protein
MKNQSIQLGISLRQAIFHSQMKRKRKINVKVCAYGN